MPMIIQHKTFFIRAILLKARGSFCSKFKNNPSLSNLQFKNQIYTVIPLYKTAASAVQLANCILLQACIHTATITNKNVI